MTITGQNFEMYAGDSKEIEIAVVDENGAPLDLTPYDAINWVAYKPTTKEIVLSKILGSGIMVDTPLAGIIKISLVPADTENIYPLIYAHECEINSGTTVVSTVCTGTMKIVYSKA
jgi:hypothetical protein